MRGTSSIPFEVAILLLLSAVEHTHHLLRFSERHTIEINMVWFSCESLVRGPYQSHVLNKGGRRPQASYIAIAAFFAI